MQASKFFPTLRGLSQYLILQAAGDIRKRQKSFSRMHSKDMVPQFAKGAHLRLQSLLRTFASQASALGVEAKVVSEGSLHELRGEDPMKIGGEMPDEPLKCRAPIAPTAAQGSPTFPRLSPELS
jgi:hypothetical protein